jgi:hypothetical protein
MWEGGMRELACRSGSGTPRRSRSASTPESRTSRCSPTTTTPFGTGRDRGRSRAAPDGGTRTDGCAAGARRPGHLPGVGGAALHQLRGALGSGEELRPVRRTVAGAAGLVRCAAAAAAAGQGELRAWAASARRRERDHALPDLPVAGARRRSGLPGAARPHVHQPVQAPGPPRRPRRGRWPVRPARGATHRARLLNGAHAAGLATRGGCCCTAATRT